MSDPIVRAAAEAVYAEERNQSMGFDQWPEWGDPEVQCGPFEEIAMAVITAVTPLIQAATWPCDNYSAPRTCLTAPSSPTGRCDHCRQQAKAVTPLIRAQIADEITQQIDMEGHGWAGNKVARAYRHAARIARGDAQ